MELLLIGLFCAIGISFVAFRLRLLTLSGTVAASLVGTLVFWLGSANGVVALLTFFISANLLGRWRRAGKRKLGFEKAGARDACQVFANGGIACVALILSLWFKSNVSDTWFVCFAAALAEANADTWATEIGAAASGSVRLITNLNPVRAGRSGGVSIAGTLAALAGSILIALVAGLPNGRLPPHQIELVAGCGFAGALFDSLLGATVQVHYMDAFGNLTERPMSGAMRASGLSWINNDVVNLLACAFSAVAAYAILCLASL